MGEKRFSVGDYIRDEMGKPIYRLLEEADYNDKFYVVHVAEVRNTAEAADAKNTVDVVGVKNVVDATGAKNLADGDECLLKFARYSEDRTANINNLVREGSFRFAYPYIERVNGNFTGIAPDGKKIYGVSVEYIKGKNLREYRNELEKDIAFGRISEEDAQKLIFRQILQFLYGMNYYIQFAGKTYLHRDLKPENIMITEKGETKIIDFDFAHISDSTKTISLVGWDLPFSSGYTSPAIRTNGENIKLPGFTEEIYSAGRLLFFWLNGRDYFRPEEVEMECDKHTNLPDPASALYCRDNDIGYGFDFNRDRFEKKYLNSSYTDLIHILEKMCCKPDEDSIYHSVKEIINDFENFLIDFYGSAFHTSEALKLDEMPLLKEDFYEGKRKGLMLAIKVDAGPRKGKLLYEYTMRDICIDEEKIMMVYNMEGQIYYIPVYGKEVRRDAESVSGRTFENDENTSHGAQYRICDGDVFIYKGKKIKFTVGK